MSLKNDYLYKAASLLVVVSVLVLSGCATLFKGTSETVSLGSEPPAEVYVNGTYRGDTPVKLDLKSDKEYDIEFRKEGFESKTVHISNSVGAGWIVLDVLGGLVPVIVDAATGAWYQLDQKMVNATLKKQQ